MDYAFGAGKRLYEQRLHPRIYLDADDVERLREKVKRGAGR